MCCIIYRKKGDTEIKQEYLKKIIDINSAGWGISYLLDDGQMFVFKSMDMTKSIEAIREAEKQNREFLFHARRVSRGDRKIENCHPFPIKNGVMYHNGTMKDIALWNKGLSDSAHFAYKVNKFLQKGRSIESICKQKYKDIVNDGRLAFMFNNGKVFRVGEWHEIDGHQYSKRDWKDELDKPPVVISTIRPKTQTTVKNITKERKTYLQNLENIQFKISQGSVDRFDIQYLDLKELEYIIQDHPRQMALHLKSLVAVHMANKALGGSSVRG